MRTEAGNEALVLATLPGILGLGVVERRPRGATASESTSKLRRHVEGARIVAVEQSRRAARLTLERGGETAFLLAAPGKPYGAWWLVDAAGALVVRSPGAGTTVPAEDGHWSAQELETLRELGERVLETHRAGRLQQLRRALGRQIKRVRKKREAILGDLERAREAQGLHEQATLLLAHASGIDRDAESVELDSWEIPGRRVRIELVPGQSPTDRAQALFAKSKRLKRGLDVVPGRLSAADSEIEELEQLGEQLVGASPAEASAMLEARGVTVVEPRERERKRRRAGERLPYREFCGEDGAAVLVGRGASDNDRLTLRVARPHDLWLHARGVTGAHVVVRLSKGKSCSPETLVDAATLAAHFSELRGEPIVDVLYTPRRFVRKPRGSAIGSVTLEREKVIAVRVEPSRMARLLGAEKKH